MNEQYQNVLEPIVNMGYCIGCGVCAGVCPRNTLEMQFNEFGEYNPIDRLGQCYDKCSLCLTSCPFWNQSEDENTITEQLFKGIPGIDYREETGYFLKCYAGYSKVDHHRENGASGGMATWFLQKLLQENQVDHVVCVTSNPDPKRLFRFSIFDSAEQVREASKSCYYPVELSSVIKEILTRDGRYAIIGLPCFIKSLRLAMLKYRKLNDRVRFLFGLVCGQMQSKLLAEYLCYLSDGDYDRMQSCRFRIKDPNRTAIDYGFEYYCDQGMNKHGYIHWTEGWDAVWHIGFFTPKACSYCDDIFAETADAVFMDAWLPEYKEDNKGTNLFMIRDPRLSRILQNGIKSYEVSMEEIKIDRIIKSQEGVISKKRGENVLTQSELSKKDTRFYIPRKRSFRIRKLRLDNYIDYRIRKYLSNSVRKNISINKQYDVFRMITRKSGYYKKVQQKLLRTRSLLKKVSGKK